MSPTERAGLVVALAACVVAAAILWIVAARVFGGKK